MPGTPRPLVLVTRPEPGAEDTAARLEALGFVPLRAPALIVRPLPARLPEPSRVAAVLVTSAQAVPGLPAAFHATPLLAVGDATAARARRAGFAQVASAAGDAADLTRLAHDRCRPGATLLLATGAGLGQPLAAALRHAGFAVLRRCVYRTRAVPRLPEPARAALRAGQVKAALFFSADSAAAFCDQAARAALGDLMTNTDAVAISPAVAVALRHLTWRRLLVADRPNQDAMFALL